MSGTALAQSAANPNNTPASENPAMHRYQSRSMVRQAQRELKQQGFYSGDIDGIDGPQTHGAIRAYQRSERLNVTGSLNRATLSSLGLHNMRPANRGEASRSYDRSEANTPNPRQNRPVNLSQDTVRAAQRKLANGGFYNGRADGTMNQGTRVAIRQYQKQHGLPVTGRLNRETAQRLGIATANMRFENNETPLEQLGKGIAEGARASNTGNTGHNY